MENYNELLNNEMENLEVVDNLAEFAAEMNDLVPVEMNEDEILKQTGKDALLAAGLIAGGLVVTHLTIKYAVPFAMKKVSEFKAKREQRKYEKELSMPEENDEE
jgi:hypothetical protein